MDGKLHRSSSSGILLSFIIAEGSECIPVFEIATNRDQDF